MEQKFSILDVEGGVLLHDIHDIRPDLKLYGCDIGDVSEYYNAEIQFSQIKDDGILPF
jgi:hypothetical protein